MKEYEPENEAEEEELFKHQGMLNEKDLEERKAGHNKIFENLGKNDGQVD